MPTTKLSKRAEAIVKNSATLKIQSPAPTRILYWDSFQERNDQEFYERASADMRKLKETGGSLHSKSATISRLCHRYERIMSYGLQHLGLPKMIWVALIEASKGACDLNSYRNACFEDDARNWAYCYFGSDYDYLKARDAHLTTLEEKACVLMKQTLTSIIHSKIFMRNYHYYVIIETFIEHFNKCRIINPETTLQQAFETFGLQQSESFLIEDIIFPVDYGEHTPFINIFEEDEYVSQHFDHSFFAQVITIGSGSSARAEDYVQENYPEIFNETNSNDLYYHIPLEVIIYLAETYQVSKNWCAKYFPDY